MKKIRPINLKGPRLYFTELDPKDKYFSPESAVRKLKLSLLTKKSVVVAASSLFHDKIAGLVVKSKLNKLINDGIILPALRSDFSSVNDFFDNYKADGYSTFGRSVFNHAVGSVVTWNLQDNSSFFENSFNSQLSNPNSFLRKSTGLSHRDILHISDSINLAISKNGFLSREIISDSTVFLDKTNKDIISNLSNLIYRISGSIAVNSDPHFPESNMTVLNHSEVNSVSDENIFWDIFVETIVEATTPQFRIPISKLDSLSFSDIEKLRIGLIDDGFIEKYDRIITTVRDLKHIKSVDDLCSIENNLANSISYIQAKFNEQIKKELSLDKNTDRIEDGLIEFASTVARIGLHSSIFPIFSTLKGLPKIIALCSPKTASNISNKVKITKNWINSRFEWSVREKKVLLDGYENIFMYHFPTRK